jgi:hypothetical protein
MDSELLEAESHDAGNLMVEKNAVAYSSLW